LNTKYGGHVDSISGKLPPIEDVFPFPEVSLQVELEALVDSYLNTKPFLENVGVGFGVGVGLREGVGVGDLLKLGVGVGVGVLLKDGLGVGELLAIFKPIQ
jgi:hypothetical protein